MHGGAQFKGVVYSSIYTGLVDGLRPKCGKAGTTPKQLSKRAHADTALSAKECFGGR
jgi:hypothetical protein